MPKDYVRHPDIDRLVSLNYNKVGLPKAYNDALSGVHDDLDGYDAVLFCHDDVVLTDIQMGRKIEAAKDRGLDIIGVAGGKGWRPPFGMNPLEVPMGWWSAAGSQFGLNGYIIHAPEGHPQFATAYGPTPARTLTLDGCFVCFMNDGLKALSDGRLKWNENYDFDFYDMALAMDAYRLGLKVGVEPIVVTHGSMGLGATKPRFIEAQRRFVREYFWPDI